MPPHPIPSQATANDYPERDPLRWKLDASNDGTTWDVLDANQDVGNMLFYTSSERHRWQGPFFPGAAHSYAHQNKKPTQCANEGEDCKCQGSVKYGRLLGCWGGEWCVSRRRFILTENGALRAPAAIM